ncbi:hypothetical protein MHYP_G00033680 [Metynnis hypsauchen]
MSTRCRSQPLGAVCASVCRGELAVNSVCVRTLRALMDVAQESVTVFVEIILSLSALQASVHLFKDHRAPSVGFFLVACSSALTGSPSIQPVSCCSPGGSRMGLRSSRAGSVCVRLPVAQ